MTFTKDRLVEIQAYLFCIKKKLCYISLEKIELIFLG